MLERVAGSEELLLSRQCPVALHRLLILRSKGSHVPSILSLGRLDAFTLGDQFLLLYTIKFRIWGSPNSD